jgi:hypothetical protein
LPSTPAARDINLVMPDGVAADAGRRRPVGKLPSGDGHE